MAKSPDEILGFEYDWLASDGAGHVGFFSTAGGGYVPDEFLRDTDAHHAAITAVLATSPCTKARFAPELSPGHQNTWRMMAERGMFAFDADVHGGPYQMVAAPEVPIQLANLPAAAAAVVRRLEFRALRFDLLPEVTKELLTSLTPPARG